MSATSIKSAIAAVEDKGIETDLELYGVVDKQPGESVYFLAKAMAGAMVRHMLQPGDLSVPTWFTSKRQNEMGVTCS